MDDEFEVYAEDNFEKELEKLGTSLRPLTNWETFDDEEGEEKVDVLLDHDLSSEKLAALKNSNIPSNLEDGGQIMFIRYKKNGESSELQDLLGQLHKEKLEDVTIIFHTTYASLNEDEIDILETFYNHYDNFHIDYEDKETPDKDPVYNSDEESDDEVSPNLVNDTDQPDDVTANHMEDMLTLRKTLMEMDYEDPRRLEMAANFVDLIVDKLKL